jgi:putative molybdopterin biosynthesis protein
MGCTGRTLLKTESEIRNRLRSVRTRLGMSQQELAAAAGVTRQTIGGIEGGQYAPSATVALRLARALACRVEDLFWLEAETAPVIAVAARGLPGAQPTRVALVAVGGRWVAHPLQGKGAFREEMVPCDGVGTREDGASELPVRLLDDPENLAQSVALAGCSPALSLWARAAERWHPGLRVYWSFANSTDALASLARGEVHAAGIHLYDPESGDFNTPFLRASALPGPAVLINLGVWEEGLLVARGNPRRLRDGADLARPDVRVINREEGSGSRRVLERALREAGVPPATMAGFDRIVRSHTAVAATVAAGEADAGVSSACVAAAFDLGFVPLQQVRYDLALLKPSLDHPPVRQLLATLDHRWVRSQLHVLGGYDTGRTGETVAEVANGG